MGTRMVTFSLGQRLYGIEVTLVQEVLRGLPRTRIPQAPPALAGLINLRGQVLTAIDLREQLGLERRSEQHDPLTVVTRVDGEVIALLVDSIGAVLDVEDAQFEPPPDTLQGQARAFVRGAYKLPDQLLLVFDVGAAVRSIPTSTTSSHDLKVPS